MSSKVKNRIIISENLRKVNLIKDFPIMGKECRESLYYLNSLHNFLKNGLIIKFLGEEQKKFNGVDENICEISNRILEVKTVFENIESKLYNNKSNVAEEKIKDLAITNSEIEFQDQIAEIETKTLFNCLIEYIKLKEKIDKLQLDTIIFINNNRDAINESIRNGERDLGLIYSQNIEQECLNYTFNHSSEEDKIVTYEVITDNLESINDLKKEKICVPYHIKVTDYSYILERYRKICKNKISLTLKLLDYDQKIKEKNELNKLNKKQYYFNIVVTIFTILSTILGLMSLTYTIKSYYNNPQSQPTYIVDINK